jgi:predicted ABC-type ATPase
VRIDRPAHPADDVTQEGDRAPAEPAPEHPVPVASDTKPTEPRTRFEYAGEASKPARDISPAGDRARPLTDQEWTEHLVEVREGLGDAQGKGRTTRRLYTIDPGRRVWAADRNRVQGSLVADLYEEAKDVPCDHRAIVAGGLAGAGKTTVLTQHAGIDLSKYLTINPDNIKEEMARRGMIPEVNGLSPMEAADLAHEESSHIAKRLAMRASADGKNIIWDVTMSSTDSTEGRIKALRDAGYTRIDGIFVDIPIETSLQRTGARHREGYQAYRSGEGFGGRYVPPELITSQRDPEWGCQNRRTYEAVKHNFDSWSIYDNSVDDQPAALIASRSGRLRHGGIAQ